MPGFQQQRAFGRLAFRLALGGRFQTVIDGVAKQVGQRRLQAFQNVAVDRSGGPGDFKAHLLARFPGEIPDHPGKAVQAVGKRHHPAADDFVVEAVGQVLQAAGKALETDDVPGDPLSGLVHPGEGFLDRRF